jgi:hypothetical protein
MAKIWNKRVAVATKAFDEGLVAQFKALGVFNVWIRPSQKRFQALEGFCGFDERQLEFLD